LILKKINEQLDAVTIFFGMIKASTTDNQ
jgi:hypothetical protein